MIRLDEHTLCSSFASKKQTTNSKSKPYKTPKELKAISIFPNESDIISMDFLYCGDQEVNLPSPVLVCLWQDYDANVNINTYNIHLKDEQCVPCKWKRNMVDAGTSLIVPSTSMKFQFIVSPKQ